MPPAVTTPCTGAASAGAAFVYLHDGDINITGGQLNINHTFVYAATGYVKVNSVAADLEHADRRPLRLPRPLVRHAGHEQQHEQVLHGGRAPGVQLSGVFFTPEAAPFTLSGGGTWGQQNAQFVSFQVQVSGGGSLTMAPDPQKSVKVPTPRGGAHPLTRDRRAATTCKGDVMFRRMVFLVTAAAALPAVMLASPASAAAPNRTTITIACDRATTGRGSRSSRCTTRSVAHRSVLR